jgi:DNA transposition AAA+ family ATPase
MKTITQNEINELYKKCGASINQSYIRTTINTGTLLNELNKGNIDKNDSQKKNSTLNY